MKYFQDKDSEEKWSMERYFYFKTLLYQCTEGESLKVSLEMYGFCFYMRKYAGTLKHINYLTRI